MSRSGDGALAPDGRRVRIEPAAVSGRFDRARRAVFVVLIAVYLALPFLTIAGRPALRLEIGARRFFILGGLFDSTDAWRMLFVLLVAAVGLLLATAVLGRAWCGWACPQTVFLDALIRPIERRFPRKGKGLPRALRAIARHSLFFLVAAVCAHAFIAYFVSPAALWRMIQGGPSHEPGVFAFAAITTGVLAFDFAVFREQMCLIICPYGRLQSLLVDKDSLVVGYDERRGEPRGKVRLPMVGDCVDCRRCIAVCPTGIDIRRGQQLDCVACTACIDACDDIMGRLGRAPGLIRYDSENGLAGQPRRLLRPRVLVYGALVVAASVGLALSTLGRAGVDVQLLRPVGAPYRLDGGEVENLLSLIVVNKGAEPLAAPIAVSVPPGARASVEPASVDLAPLARARVSVTVRFPRGTHGARLTVAVAGEEVSAALVSP